MEKLLSPSEAAKLLNVGYRNIIDMIHLGQLEAIKIGRQFRIHPKFIHKFLEKNKYQNSNPFNK